MIRDLIVLIITTLLLAILGFVAGVTVAEAKTIKIAVIDTGFNYKYDNQVKLCKDGHRDFTKTTIKDEHGHGTHIVGTMVKEIEERVDYCIMVLKYYSTRSYENQVNTTILALDWAVMQGADIINYSAGGPNPAYREKLAIERALDKGVILVVAAGNEANDLNKVGYYPAQYDNRLIVVGNVNKEGKREPSSNYGGNVDLMVNGKDVEAFGMIMTGTSQATAKVTGRIVNQLNIRQILKQNTEYFGPVNTDNYRFEYERYTAQ